MWRRPVCGATKRRRATTNWSRGILRLSPDHAAEFWLEVGGNPDRARWLAMKNLQVRQTPRARELLTRATLASDRAQAIHHARDGDGA